jgi:hypothetical protein
MFRYFANVYAKLRFRWKEEVEAGIAELSAKASLKRAKDTRALIARTTKEMDDMDARINEVEASSRSLVIRTQ